MATRRIMPVLHRLLPSQCVRSDAVERLRAGRVSVD